MHGPIHIRSCESQFFKLPPNIHEYQQVIGALSLAAASQDAFLEWVPTAVHASIERSQAVCEKLMVSKPNGHVPAISSGSS